MRRPAVLTTLASAFMVSVAACGSGVDGTATASDEVLDASETEYAATTSVEPSSDFDPCALPDALLRDLDLVEAQPTAVGELGCIWGNDRIAVSVLVFEDTSTLPDPYTSPSTTEVRTLTDGGYTTYAFLLDGDTYTTQTMTASGAVMLSANRLGVSSAEEVRAGSVDVFRVVLPYLPPPA
ncbi:DUF3558 domain-containing protein [Rhodococcus sp. 06-621-2]|nr:DUF3558 family protein [Rhodococcus sp. 06-621-2]OZC46824.1 DUF3558 domain-containing protein [Rhodococcus sp. 06-621-2]